MRIMFRVLRKQHMASVGRHLPVAFSILCYCWGNNLLSDCELEQQLLRLVWSRIACTQISWPDNGVQQAVGWLCQAQFNCRQIPCQKNRLEIRLFIRDFSRLVAQLCPYGLAQESLLGKRAKVVSSGFQKKDRLFHHELIRPYMNF